MQTLKGRGGRPATPARAGHRGSRRMMDQVRRFGRPLFVLTGVDPLKRPDIVELVRYGASIGLRMAMTPSGRPLMTPEILSRLVNAGLSRLAVSLDGSTATIHDAFRAVAGSYDWTLEMLRAAAGAAGWRFTAPAPPAAFWRGCGAGGSRAGRRAAAAGRGAGPIGASRECEPSPSGERDHDHDRATHPRTRRTRRRGGFPCVDPCAQRRPIPDQGVRAGRDARVG
jgi:hypothetical protein